MIPVIWELGGGGRQCARRLSQWNGTKPANMVGDAIPCPVPHPHLTALAVWVSAPAAVGLLIAFTLYQASYEYLHYCMHVPRSRWFERTSAFRWIDAHHLQHHRKHGTNLNIVLPIADYVLRTRQRPGRPTMSQA